MVTADSQVELETEARSVEKRTQLCEDPKNQQKPGFSRPEKGLG